jgi:hypothetical protein
MTTTTSINDVKATEAEALQWLAGRVRWERLLADLRDNTNAVVDFEEAA